MTSIILTSTSRTQLLAARQELASSLLAQGSEDFQAWLQGFFPLLQRRCSIIYNIRTAPTAPHPYFRPGRHDSGITVPSTLSTAREEGMTCVATVQVQSLPNKSATLQGLEDATRKATAAWQQVIQLGCLPFYVRFDLA